jgi:hypothetical protein
LAKYGKSRFAAKWHSGTSGIFQQHDNCKTVKL